MSTEINTAVHTLTNFIGGRPIECATGRSLPVTEPNTGAIIAEVPLSNSEDLDLAVKAAKEAQPRWGRMPIKDRV